jgi:3-oxoacyl-(acyl-carrier-protein) synthase
MKAKRRIAVTGLGMVTPVGNDASSTWARLRAGKSGVDEIRYFDASSFPVRIGAEVKNFELSPELAKAMARRPALNQFRHHFSPCNDCKDDGRAQHETRHRYNLRKVGSFKSHVPLLPCARCRAFSD